MLSFIAKKPTGGSGCALAAIQKSVEDWAAINN